MQTYSLGEGRSDKPKVEAGLRILYPPSSGVQTILIIDLLLAWSFALFISNIKGFQYTPSSDQSFQWEGTLV